MREGGRVATPTTDQRRRRPRGETPRGLRQRRISLARLARFRETTYRLLSQAFLYPEKERLAAVAATARELLDAGGALARFAFFGPWSELLSHLRDADQREPTRAQEEWVALFAASPGGVPCPPYESVYREPTGGATGWVIAQVEYEYGAVGLAPSPDLGDLPDHVAVELEFVAVLCGYEAQAWDGKNAAGGIKALRRQKTFLGRHLALWLPEFARGVAAAGAGHDYAALSEGARAFVSYDKDLVDALLETVPGGDSG